MNGTSTMTGIACIVIDRARKIIDAAYAATGLCIHALMGNAHHYDPTISRAKPHPGPGRSRTQDILGLLDANRPHSQLEADELETLQDPYSLRCSPQILGVLVDALEWISRWVEIEANSANDNPLFDPDTGEVLMGGNFYGGHIVFAMDSLKAALASVADMSDRQVAAPGQPAREPRPSGRPGTRLRARETCTTTDSRRCPSPRPRWPPRRSRRPCRRRSSRARPNRTTRTR